MIEITKDITLKPDDFTLTFIVASGPGGQNVNKVATAVQLRFNVFDSRSLPEDVRGRLILLLGKRLTALGDLIIKANRHRTQERNKQDAIERLCDLIKQAAVVPRKRRKTKPTYSSKQRRLNTKKIHGMKKSMRRDKGE